MRIGIVGNGFVGKATQVLHNEDVEMLVYDIIPELCKPLGITLKDFTCCDLIFVCVPTPSDKNGNCYIEIVNKVVKELQLVIDNEKTQIVIRSTVLPGTSDSNNVFFMPEFLTESRYIEDFVNNKHWIFGLKENSNAHEFKKNISNLFNLAHKHNKIKYKNLHFLTNKEAETIKYVKNCFFALKVSFFNEINAICKNNDIKYSNVIKGVLHDERIGQSHTMVPGPDDQFGFGGICLPKDILAFRNYANSSNVRTPIIDATINRNNSIDRPEKDWKVIGRSII